MAYGVYGVDGLLRTTQVDGSTRTGLYASDGSYNIVLDDVTYKGIYHPCGAYRVNSSQSTSVYDASGAFYINHFLGTPLGGAVPVMPSGALGIWFAKDAVTTPRRVIPNSVGAKLTDSNMLMYSRRRFSSTGGAPWTNSGAVLTITDNNQTAPDGSTEATTITGSSGTNWALTSSNNTRNGTNKTINGQTYTLAISVKSLSGGSLSFGLGDQASSTIGQKTATTSWGRFTQTFVATGSSCNIRIQEPTGTGAANFAICDFELFNGPADLNVNALTAKPPRIQNMDWLYDDAAGTVVAAGVFQSGSYGMIQMDQARNLNPFTFVYLTKWKQDLGHTHSCWIADDIGGFSSFLVGKVFGSMSGAFPSGNDIAGGAGSNALQPFAHWGEPGTTIFAGAARYSGTKGNQFVNGVGVAEHTQSIAGPNVMDLGVGQFSGTFNVYDVYAMALYSRSLTDAEVVQAGKALAAQAAVTVPSRRIIYGQGTSISFGTGDTGSAIGSEGFFNRLAPNLNPAALGWNDAVSGSGVASVAVEARVAAIRTNAVAAGATFTDTVAHIEWGANNPNDAANLAARCDTLRAAGWKVVISTILPRDDNPTWPAATFEPLRQATNTLIRSWIGVHCDAVADHAGGAGTMDAQASLYLCSGGALMTPSPATGPVTQVVAGGTGYTPGAQVLTLVGGTFTVPAQLNVTVSAGGVVTSVNSVAVAGNYTVMPSSQADTTGGGGTGCKLQVIFGGTYFCDRVHPTHAGHVLMEVVSRAAINSI